MTSSPSKHSAPGPLRPPPLDGNSGHAPAARPTQSETEAAIRTLIAWLGDDPDRIDLQGTPARVARHTANCSPAIGRIRWVLAGPDARAEPAASW